MFRLLAALSVFYEHAIAHFEISDFCVFDYLQKLIPEVPIFSF